MRLRIPSLCSPCGRDRARPRARKFARYQRAGATFVKRIAARGPRRPGADASGLMALDDGNVRRHRAGRRSGRDDVRDERGAARPARTAARAWRAAGRQNSDLRRRTLQFHQPRGHARALSLRQSALLQVRAQPLHRARLHRDGRAPSYPLSRENPGPALLRRLGARDSRDAARGMCGGRGRSARRPSRHRRHPRRPLPRRDRPRQLHRAGAGDRDRRALDSENGRERLRLRSRAPLRPCV